MKDFEVFDIGVVNIRTGKNVKISSSSNIYGCELGDDTFVGPFVEIQRNVKIGPRVRIQSHTFICEFVTIGSDVFIGHGVMFINDLLKEGPARRDLSKYKETVIGDRVSIGSNSTILPVKICDDVVIGAGSVVTRDLNFPGIYFGNPARLRTNND